MSSMNLRHLGLHFLICLWRLESIFFYYIIIKTLDIYWPPPFIFHSVLQIVYAGLECLPCNFSQNCPEAMKFVRNLNHKQQWFWFLSKILWEVSCIDASLMTSDSLLLSWLLAAAMLSSLFRMQMPPFLFAGWMIISASFCNLMNFLKASHSFFERCAYLVFFSAPMISILTEIKKLLIEKIEGPLFLVDHQMKSQAVK